MSAIARRMTALVNRAPGVGNKVDAGAQSRVGIMVKKKRKFEHALQELEAIVDRLDGDETDLDDAIDLFEKGVQLVGECRQRLQSAEKRLKDLEKSVQDGIGEESKP